MRGIALRYRLVFEQPEETSLLVAVAAVRFINRPVTPRHGLAPVQGSGGGSRVSGLDFGAHQAQQAEEQKSSTQHKKE